MQDTVSLRKKLCPLIQRPTILNQLLYLVRVLNCMFKCLSSSIFKKNVLVSFAFLKPKYLTCLLTLNSSLDSSWVALLKRKAWFQNSVLSSSRSHKIELGRRFLWYCCRLVDNKYSRPLENKQAGSSAQTTTTTQATQFDAYAPISVATELDRYWVITRASSLLRPRPPPTPNSAFVSHQHAHGKI